ncbi:Uncharacterised protein [Mycobacteroides abscessus subsp. massiliense]|nr:Uncharacterised protein [Mycobacteroides abscessus subsp. massiliense]
MVHGVAGYAAGCRCESCFSAQRAREAQIGAAERSRWSPVVQRAERKRLERVRVRRRYQETIERERVSAAESAR